jgi:hypothetical protein
VGELGSLGQNTTNGHNQETTKTKTRKETHMSIEINESSLRFDDGLVINLVDIKDVRSAGTVIGHPNHPLMVSIASELGKGHGVVYVLYVTRQGPATQLISTADPPSALSLAQRIQEAVAIARKEATSSERVTVGECAQCHRPIRVKAHAVRPQMILTCKCGHQNKLTVASAPR